ncbi:aminotransferase class V-fold PLP-dependent enzyme [Virgibacillus sp. W0181]|uniref:aminotransferase class V-fold PLP-dependent enzyme n=1 Tax=Virgibacillus sp. W0181 TaxID=3391581 RepID=UPI003F474475
MSNEFSPEVQKYIEKGEKILAHQEKRRQEMKKKKFDTIAVHGIYGVEEALEHQGSLLEPTFFTPAQQFADSNHLEAVNAYVMPGWAYTRIINPTITYLEETLALLEGYGYKGDTGAAAFSSGMAAIYMATNPFIENPEPGTNIVVDAKCYGGTFMLLSRYSRENGIEVRWVTDSANTEDWVQKVDDKTRFVYAEMPSNPGLSLVDLEAIAVLAHDHGIPLIVDSTLTTPALMRPIALGADIVVHSVSKAMAGSGSAIAGAIISKMDIPSKVGTDEMKADFATYIKLLSRRDHGNNIAPMNAHFVLNDLRHLRARVDKMSKSAMKIAEFLETHENVESVGYPGLKSNSGHNLAKKYMWLADGSDDYGQEVNRYGYMMSFNVKGGVEKAKQVFDQFKMIFRATDLGRVKSVATLPAVSTHQQQGDEGRELASLPSNLVRLSVGMEHPDDIIDDLKQALDSVK